MSRPLIIVSTIVGIVVICVAALMALLDNPSAYKQRISAAVQDQTGYGLVINGDIQWRYFPPIAIALTDIDITTPKSTAPLASLKSANVDLKLIPLIFGGSVEVSRVSVDGLTVNAEVDARGTGNWEVSTAESTSTDSTNETNETEAGDSLSVDIGGIDITNATVNYLDKATNSHIVLTVSQFRTGPLGTGITTNIIGDLDFADKTSTLTATISLAGKAAINESLEEFTLENFVVTSTVNQPDTAPLATTLKLNGKVNTRTGIAKLNNSELALADLKLAFGIEATDIFGTTAITGNISAPTFNAKQLLAALDAPMETENPDALTQVSLDADIKGNLDHLKLTNLNLNLDQSKLNGVVTLILTAKTGIDFNLSIDKIIASDYLEPAGDSGSDSASTANTNATTTTTEGDSEVIPVSTLQDIDLNGTFTINNLQYDTWDATDFKLKVNNLGQQFSITAKADAYNGSMTFQIASNYAGKTASTTSTFTSTGIDITKALEFDAITGTLELNANHTFKGHMMSDLVSSLNGRSTFNIADGTLDVSPIKKIAAIVDSLQGKESGIAEWPDMLPFSFLKGDHNFNAGIIENQTLTASIENMRIGGNGGIDYFANTLIYDLEATLLETGGQFKVNTKLTGVRFPLHCEGSLDAEVMELCLPDRSAITNLIKDLAAQEIKRQGTDAIKKKLEEQIPDELKDKAKDLLKGFFN
jgi:AsmA protein